MSSRVRSLVAGILPALVIAAAACGADGDPRETWPFNAMHLPPSEGEAGPSDGETSAPEVRSEASGDEAARPSDEGSPGAQSASDGSPADAGTRPRLGMGSQAIDLERSGPLVHTRPVTDFIDARFPRPRRVRGLYLNAWTAGSSTRMPALLDLARRTEVNTFVIDVKDATGFLSHATSVPLAHEIGATEERRIADLPALLDRLESEGVYPIARIVVVKDPLLARARPELAIQDSTGNPWIDGNGAVWMNPYQREVWEYNVQIARELAEMGFPEVQWDYIRFPDAPEEELARVVFPGHEGRTRSAAIRGFLLYARDALADLPVRSTADVFGVTTTYRSDIGLGQLWEAFIDVVDVALPMVYPSHYYTESFGFSEPNAYPYEVVRAAMEDALGRSARVRGAGYVRPWIQDFTLGRPRYGPAEVRAQIQGAYDAGIEEWILWNPASRYTEAALEPVGGFEEEPLIRVAGVVAPVSRRREVIDSINALPRRGGAGTDSSTVDTIARPDTVGRPDLVTADTVARPDTVVRPDTVARPDTVSLPDTVAPPDTVGPRVDTLVAPPDTGGVAIRRR